MSETANIAPGNELFQTLWNKYVAERKPRFVEHAGTRYMLVQDNGHKFVPVGVERTFDNSYTTPASGSIATAPAPVVSAEPAPKSPKGKNKDVAQKESVSDE